MKTENPFANQRGLLELYNSKDPSVLSRLFKQIKDNKLLRTLFHIISFDIGSIVNRVIDGEKSSGGQSVNTFWQKYLEFLIQEDKEQFIVFLPLIVKYVGWRELLSFIVNTKKFKTTIIGTFGLLEIIVKDKFIYPQFLHYVASVLNTGSEYEKHLVYKYIHKPKFSKRIKVDKSKRDLQPRTIQKMKILERFLTDLSNEMNWYINKKDTYNDFLGFRMAKRPYQGELIDFLFTNGNILAKSKADFQDLLNRLPAGARFKLRRILLDSEDNSRKPIYNNLSDWFKDWENQKEDANQKVRNLELIGKTRKLSITEEVQFEQLKKQAKVTTGNNSLREAFTDVLLKNKVDRLLIESIARDIKFDVNVLPMIDISGSMGDSGGLPIKFAQLALSLILRNNKTLVNLFATFESKTRIISDGVSMVNTAANKYMTPTIEKVNEKIYDHSKSFYDNYNNLSKYLRVNGSTNVSGLAETLLSWVNDSSTESEKSIKIEQINEYPVIMILTDSYFNNAKSAEASLEDFKKKMLEYFGWDGIIIVWGIPYGELQSPIVFEQMSNLYFTRNFNLGQINNVFSKLKDLEVIDIYTDLESLYNNKRYEIIKKSIICSEIN